MMEEGVAGANGCAVGVAMTSTFLPLGALVFKLLRELMCRRLRIVTLLFIVRLANTIGVTDSVVDFA